MVEYKIYGPGSSSGSPVYQEVACSETSTDICFIVSSTTKVDDCFTDTIFEKKCMPVDLSTLFPIDCSCVSADTKPVLMSGETSWGEAVWYEIKQIRDICPQEDPTTPTSRTCDIGDYWITKSGNTLFVNYEYFEVKDYGDYVDIDRKTSGTSTTCKSIECFITGTSGGTEKDGKYHINNSGGVASFISTEDNEITILTPCGEKKPITFRYNCDDGKEKCSGTSYYIKSITFDPLYVENSGGSVNTTVTYEKVEKNSDCSETKTTGILRPEAITIPGCVDEETDCYLDRYINISLTSLTTSLTDGDLYYNGRKVIDDVLIPYLELGKEHEDEGCGEYTTTYCVDSSTVKVYYETYYGSGIWVDVGKVPESGGNIKVTWGFEKTDTPSNPACKTYKTSGTWSETIYVPKCPGDTPASEFDGEILFKTQTPGCTTCESERGMNKVAYSGKQECTCVSSTTIDIERVVFSGENEVGECEYCVSGSPKVTTTIHRADCEDEVKIDYPEMTFCFGVNTTNKKRYPEDSYFYIEQAKGPCNEKTCSCNTFTFINRAPGGNLCEELDFVFPEVHIPCGYTDKVIIPYYGNCSGVTQVSGSLIWEDNFICSTSGSTTYTFKFDRPDDVGKPWYNKEIKVIQCEDGTCDCDCE